MQNTRCLERLTCDDACDKPGLHKPREAPAGRILAAQQRAQRSRQLQLMIGIPASQTGIRAGDGCSRTFLRIRRLSNGRSALREERRAPSASQHRLAVLLPLVHLLKLLNNLVAQLVHLRW
jgi:hypothetical protein